jgi:hypothetical protein
MQGTSYYTAKGMKNSIGEIVVNFRTDKKISSSFFELKC